MRIFLLIIFLLVNHSVIADTNRDEYIKVSSDSQAIFRKALSEAKAGNPTAQGLTGMMYAEGFGVEQNYQEAVKWFGLASKNGNTEATFRLAFLYFDGLGVPQSLEDFIKLLRQAASKGNVNAQNRLGLAYLKGEGVLQDSIKAHIWFNIAAIKGNKNSAEGRDLAASIMTPQQLADAQRLAKTCLANLIKCD